MPEQRFPEGWDAARVQRVIDYYEGQTEDEAAAEIEAMLDAEGITMMAVPNHLVEQVRPLIDRDLGEA
jgi:hypothetical protein